MLLDCNPTPAALFLGVIGISLLGYGLWRVFTELRPRHWLRIPGTVTSSTLKPNSTFKGGVTFVPVIEYEYLHEGQTFTSSRQNPTNYALGNRITGNRIIARYPVGGGVVVLVNPNRLEQSVLEYGITAASWLSIAYGIIFLLLTFFLAFEK